MSGKDSSFGKFPAFSPFLAFSPTDYRYAVEDLRAFLSEEAFVKYKARVEAALAKAFASKGILRKASCEEIVRACEEAVSYTHLTLPTNREV